MTSRLSGAQLDHVAIFVTDVAAARDFYGVIGFTETTRLEIGERIHSFLSLDGSDARLQVSGPVPAADAGGGHLALRVDDVDAAFERLVESGAGVADRPHDIPEAAARVAMVSDPDGHKIELIAALDPA